MRSLALPARLTNIGMTLGERHSRCGKSPLKLLLIAKTMVLLAAMCVAGVASGAVATGSLRCEYLNDPLGIDVVKPRLGWVLEADRRGEQQKAGFEQKETKATKRPLSSFPLLPSVENTLLYDAVKRRGIFRNY